LIRSQVYSRASHEEDGLLHSALHPVGLRGTEGFYRKEKKKSWVFII
jgi:hypothetical protein